jgi:CubicO group peptidase (beta-lactamase class C family)
MNSNTSQSLTVLGSNKIHEILVKRIDQQKQALGIIVGVIDPNGRRIIAHGKLAATDSRMPDGDTIFEIGSISKIFTSLLLAEMVERKEVALEDRVAKYLPEHVTIPERNSKAITLLDLSTHTSGLPPLPGNLLDKIVKRKNDPQSPDGDYTVDDLYQFLCGYTLPRDPGSEFVYSNLGAGLLGHILARRAGTDYESLIQTRIAQPLGMPDTAIALSASMQQRMATGHNAALMPLAHADLPLSLAGAGALRSSVHDMLTFLEAFLGYRESPLAPAMKAMLEVHRPAGEAMIGLGWLIKSTDGPEIVWHNGGTAGFRSFAGYDPKARTGVVVLANAFTQGGVDDIGFHILNPKAPLATPEPPAQHTEVRIDPKLLDNYTGRYQVTANLTLEVTRDGERLFAQGLAQFPHKPAGELTTLPKFELFAEGEKNFFAKVSDKQVVFETGADGRATGFILHQTGRQSVSAPRIV